MLVRVKEGHSVMRNFGPGEVLDLPGGEAERLISRGVVEKVEQEEAKKEPKKKGA